jgi:thioredoxin-like negative regulator of GroEL
MIELLLQAERALSVGLLDRAETLYGKVAAADPLNAIAVIGLARVALERGDEVGALELARRGLSIDPENDAARRMVQRLEEVRAYRGSGEGAATGGAEAAVPADAAAIGKAEAAVQADDPTASGDRRSIIDRLLRRG